MNLSEVRERCRRVGLPGVARLRKGEAIRALQRAEGNQDCFGADWRFECGQLNCCWRADCLTKNPG